MKLSIEKIQKVIERYLNGDLIDDIYDEEGISRNTTFRILKEAGLTGSRSRRFTIEEKQKYIDLVKAGQTLREVAAHGGPSRRRLQEWLSQANVHPSNRRYHTAETRQKALEMLQNGENTDQIASTLGVGNRGTINKWARQAGTPRSQESRRVESNRTRKINRG